MEGFSYLDWFSKVISKTPDITEDVDYDKILVSTKKVTNNSIMICLDESLILIITKDMKLYLYGVCDAVTGETVNLYRELSNSNINLDIYSLSNPYYKVIRGFLKGRSVILDSNVQALRVVPCEHVDADAFGEPVYPTTLSIEEDGKQYNIRYVDFEGNLKVYFEECKDEIVGIELRSEQKTHYKMEFSSN